MKFQKWHLGLITLVVVALVGGLVWYFKGAKNENVLGTKTEETNNSSSSSTNNSYVSDKANVMYFYSDECHYCQEQAKVLEELAKDGYKVKPMNIGVDYSLAQKYSIEGTPTFIGKNNEKKVGYMKKEELRAFLDKNK